MRELSEKEIEIEYRDVKLTDIPDMWNDIERNLAPKRRKRVIPVRRIASMAAVVAAVILLIPVASVVLQSEKGNMDANDGMGEDVNQEMMDAENNMASDESEQKAEDNNEDSAANGDDGSEQEDVGPNEPDGLKDIVLQLEVEIHKAAERGKGIIIAATVADILNDSSEGVQDFYEIGEEVVIIYEYDELGYTIEDFTGNLVIACEEKEGEFKLLEILEKKELDHCIWNHGS